MSQPLWTWDALVAAAGATAEEAPANAITGFSIDSRTIAPGDVFVALKDARDGHDFVGSAFARGAAAALVESRYSRGAGDGTLLRVADPLAALAAIGRAARKRTRARVIAVTGSVGKTGTKEALRLCLSRLGTTHAAEKSFNNHWGVPLTLARLPADAAFAVFEIGMNHAGEISPLARLVAPHVAVVMNVGPVHIANFASVAGIAEAKSEIFHGLAPGGTAVLNRDNNHFGLLETRAKTSAARILTFGQHADADIRLDRWTIAADHSEIAATVLGRHIAYRVGAPGAHLAFNSLGVLAALEAVGADLEQSIGGLSDLRAPPGRGARQEFRTPGGTLLLIDESYNGNPISVRVALVALGQVPRRAFPRRIAVLGDMLELGPAAADLHRGLKDAIDASGADLVFACGPMMKLLFDDLPASQQGFWADTSAKLEGRLMDVLRAGDAVMIKGSLGSRMGPLAAAVTRRFGAA